MKKKAYILGYVCVACLILAGYVSSYVMFTEKVDASKAFNVESLTWRVCDHHWMEAFFTPLAKVEGLFTGEEITVLYRYSL